MQDKELDKLINDAANQHHPPYDDEAWDKMLVLLDKHLPEKKDRRRPVIFWLLFLLLGGAVTLGLLQPWNHHKEDQPILAAAKNAGTSTEVKKEGDVQATGNTATAGSGTANNTTVPGGNEVQAKNSRAANDAAPTARSTPQPVMHHQNNPVVTRYTGNKAIANSPDNFVKNNSQKIKQKGRSVIKVKQPVPASDDDIAANTVKSAAPAAGIAAEPDDASNNSTAIKPVEANKAAEEKTIAADKQKEQPQQKDTAVKEQPVVTKATAGNNKKDRSFAGNFALSFSTGADMSFIDLKNPGKVKLFYGAGAAYNIGKHIRLSGGFYVSKKEYYAEPYQYKFPNGAVYPHLTGINADCKVYEIPLSIFYNFQQHHRHNWFAGTSISSFLMKTEDYKYLYQTPTGQSYAYTRSIADENKHYFSVITLSGGYQYHLNKRISLAAEPYLKLPLGGVGAGKIKLNSSGIAITAFVKPFAKSR